MAVSQLKTHPRNHVWLTYLPFLLWYSTHKSWACIALGWFSQPAKWFMELAVAPLGLCTLLQWTSEQDTISWLKKQPLNQDTWTALESLKKYNRSQSTTVSQCWPTLAPGLFLLKLNTKFKMNPSWVNYYGERTTENVNAFHPLISFALCFSLMLFTHVR